MGFPCMLKLVWGNDFWELQNFFKIVHGTPKITSSSQCVTNMLVHRIEIRILQMKIPATTTHKTK